MAMAQLTTEFRLARENIAVVIALVALGRLGADGTAD